MLIIKIVLSNLGFLGLLIFYINEKLHIFLRFKYKKFRDSLFCESRIFISLFLTSLFCKSFLFLAAEQTAFFFRLNVLCAHGLVEIEKCFFLLFIKVFGNFNGNSYKLVAPS